MTSSAALTPRDRSQEAQRGCLKCRRPFKSSGRHNRICPRCIAQVNDLAGGIAPAATLGTRAGRVKTGGP